MPNDAGGLYYPFHSTSPNIAAGYHTHHPPHLPSIISKHSTPSTPSLFSNKHTNKQRYSTSPTTQKTNPLLLHQHHPPDDHAPPKTRAARHCCCSPCSRAAVAGNWITASFVAVPVLGPGHNDHGPPLPPLPQRRQASPAGPRCRCCLVRVAVVVSSHLPSTGAVMVVECNRHCGRGQPTSHHHFHHSPLHPASQSIEILGDWPRTFPGGGLSRPSQHHPLHLLSQVHRSSLHCHHP